MKYRLLSTIKDIFGIMLNYFLVLCVLISFEAAAENQLSPLRAVFYLAFPVVFYVIRKYISNILAFTVLHLIIWLGTVALIKGDLTQTIVMAAIIGIFAISSFVRRLHSSDPKENSCPVLFAVLIFLAATLLANKLDDVYASRALAVVAVLYVTVLLLYQYLSQFIWFDFLSRETITNMPTISLLKGSAPYVAGLSAAYALIAGICLNEGFLRRLSQRILDGITNLFKWFLSHLKVVESSESGEYIQFNSEPTFDALTQLTAKQEPSPFWEILEKFFSFFAAVITVVGAVALVLAIVIAIIRKFHSKDERKPLELTDDYVEEREKIEVKKEKVRRTWFRASNAEKVRNLYVKLVRKTGVIKSEPAKFTVREFSSMFENELLNAATNFAQIYEKARYSPYTVSDDDVKAASKYADILFKGKE